MRTVVIPAAAGMLAALGLVIAGERRDEVLTVLTPLDGEADLTPALAPLRRRLERSLPGAEISASADCRYAGQSHYLTVPWDPARPAADLAAAFHEAHLRRYGDHDVTRTVEVVSIRAAGIRPGVAPGLGGSTSAPRAAGPATLPVDGATAWIAPGWRARPGPAGAVVVER